MVHIFIINPHAVNHRFAEDIRERLSKIEDLNYFVFYTREAEKETQLVRRVMHFFTDEKIRFYCCGGSGTICNVINGIDDLSKVEIAYFPCGLSNLFLQNFGDNQKYFYKIENLIEGKAVQIDFIRGNHGSALNAFSVGVDATIINKINEYEMYSVFGKALPVSLAFFKAFTSRLSEQYDIRMGTKKLSGRFLEVYFGNGCCVGKGIYVTEKADITDGKAIGVICKDGGGIAFSRIIKAMKKKRFEQVSTKVDIQITDMVKIRRTDGKPFQVNLDGELQEPQTEWEVRVVNKGLNFVIPKGVTVCE